jgi:hypothetical protein
MKLALALMAAATAMFACGLPDSRVSTTTFDGGKKLELFAAYSTKAGSVSVAAFADVADGTPGTLEMTGPFHMRCQGQFRPPDAGFSNPDDLPDLDIGEGHDGTGGIQPPQGNYTAGVTIPSENARITKVFFADGPSINKFTGLIDMPVDCWPVADTLHQMEVMLPAYVMAVQVWVNRMDQSAAETRLLALAEQAIEAVSSADHSAALSDLTQISEIAQALNSESPAQSGYILRYTLDSIALLTQPAPLK